MFLLPAQAPTLNWVAASNRENRVANKTMAIFYVGFVSLCCLLTLCEQRRQSCFSSCLAQKLLLVLSFFFCDFILGRSSRGVNDENLSTTFPNGAVITFGMAVKLK